MRYLGLSFLVLAIVACNDPARTTTLDLPTTARGQIFPRQALVIDVDASHAQVGQFMFLAAPADTERVALRSYPIQCDNGERAPSCDLIAFMWGDGGGASFFRNTGQTSRWNATLIEERDERRGMLYLRPGAGAAIRDSVGRFTTYATIAQIRCAEASCDSPARLHAVVQTTDAVKPGISPSDQPVRSFDGILHVIAGENVSVFGPGNLDSPGPLSSRVTVDAAPSSPAPDVSSPWLQTNAAGYDLRILPDAIQADIPFSFTNRSSQTLFYGLCQPVFPEKWAFDRWLVAYSVACALPGGLPPDSVRAGRTITDTVHISNSRRPRTYPRFGVDPIPGQYRLRFYVSTRDGKSLPLSQTVSNTFTLRLP